VTDSRDTQVSTSDVTDAAEAFCSTCNGSFPADATICPHDGARLIRLAEQRDNLLGRVLDGRYEIRAPLGKGGMGTVYRGWQLSVDREVAIKVIHPKLASDRAAVKRFLREAKLASRLSQPNVVGVYDFGQADNVLYLVMELLRGRPLALELTDARRLNLRRVAVIGTQLCDALEAAHAQGIVHRDLKPGNIVILDDPPGRDLIKVLDFGLAKSLVEDSGSRVTNSDAILGTPLYMAPEQIEGKPSDQRADLYALGCMFYEMVSGAPPFVDRVVSAVLARHIADTPPPLPAHVPDGMRALIEQLLVKDPAARIQTAGEVRTRLEAVMEAQRAQPISDAPDTMPEIASMGDALADTAMATRVPAPPAAAISVAPSPPPGSRRGLAIVLVALVPLVALGAWFAWPRGAAPKPDAAPLVTPVATPMIAPDAVVPDAAPVLDETVPPDATPRAPPDAPRTIHHVTRPRPDAGDDVDFYPAKPR